MPGLAAMTPRTLLPIYKAARAQGIDGPVARRMAQDALSPLRRMRAHAPIPWMIPRLAEPDDIGFADQPVSIVCAAGRVVAMVSNDAPADEANATALRIVECVNALQGVINPAAYLDRLRGYASLLEAETAP